jgi:Domain of unknown function (DUF3067)
MNASCLLLFVIVVNLVSPTICFSVLSKNQKRDNCHVIPVHGIVERGGDSDSDVPTGSEEWVDGDNLSLEAFQKAKAQISKGMIEEKEFDGYDFRDIIYAKWGQCYDVDFNRVDTFGFKAVYLNIFPFYLGRKPFRHESEYDYLCHLQAVVEILQQYGQLDYVLYQIGETKKKPIPGRSPLVAVPCRLDLTEEQVNSILG